MYVVLVTGYMCSVLMQSRQHNPAHEAQAAAEHDTDRGRDKWQGAYPDYKQVRTSISKHLPYVKFFYRCGTV